MYKKSEISVNNYHIGQFQFPYLRVFNDRNKHLNYRCQVGHLVKKHDLFRQV